MALVLVDGQKLLDYAGEEEKYLSHRLFWGLRGGLEKLKDDILADGEPLTEFPRIWILALSKADLHPGLNAEAFQDLIIEKAADDIPVLQDTLKTFRPTARGAVLGARISCFCLRPGSSPARSRSPSASAWESTSCRWPPCSRLRGRPVGREFDIPLKVLGGLVDHADALAALLAGPGIAKFLAKVPKVGPVLAPIAVPALAEAVKLGHSKLAEVHAQALADRDFLTAVVTQFRLDLDQGVEDRLFVKSLW